MTDKTEGISLALGTFDGFHLGHLAVINAAKSSSLPAYVLLFDEHPLKAITGKAPAELLCERVLFRLREEMKLPAIHLNFESVMDMSAEEFFYGFLIDDLDVRELSCGENYTFGEGGHGDIKLLKQLCDKNGIKLNTVPTVLYDGEPISSTRIRNAIANGEIGKANEMLGRPFSYAFPVIHGDSRGRTFGYPTANQLLPEDFIKMKRGVYASACRIGGKLYPAVTNYGVRPTVDGSKVLSETHVIGFDGDLYSKLIEVQILCFLREEIKFPDTEALRQAIEKDTEKAVTIFNKRLEKAK